ncbi:porin [Paraburkholderia sacchari]|uniref:porin n=1 Tax=Paraburkholderia sacchari TaxID=159450 RepID=UPI001BD153BD|nr:porin [Paraburkholderia sacchari]
MKKNAQRRLFGFAAVTSLAAVASAPAFAQSSVTLYGIVDEGVMFLNNTGGATGGKKIFLDSTSGINGSRWGFKGSEDLGGGLQAIFTLEGGININNGQSAQGGTFLGRQAFVGLSSNKFGSLTFGRQYDSIIYFLQPLTSQGSQAGSAAFQHPGDLDNTGNSVRVNNAVRFMSQNYGGFTFGGEYSVGGVAGNVTANSGYSVGAAYSNGPFSFGAIYEYFKNPTSATAGSGFFTDNANGSSQLAYSLNKGYASATAYQVIGAGAGYTIGSLSLATSYTNVQYGNLGAGFAGATARFNNVDFTAKYMVTPTFAVMAAYDYLNGSGVTKTNGQMVGDQRYNQVSVMGDYFLSKRTDVYLEGAWQRASGTSSTGAAAVANIGSLGDSSNNHQFVVRAALRHRF